MKLDRRWLVLPAAVLLGVAVHRREAKPSGAVTRFTPVADSVAAFAACMGWDGTTVRRIRTTPHYVRPSPDTIAATNGSHVWVVPLDHPYPALRHEWVHLALWPDADPAHRSVHWFRAATCGAITQHSLVL